MNISVSKWHSLETVGVRKRLIAVALFVIIMSLIWSLTATWFSAHRIINYDLEMDGYFLSFATLIGGAFLYALLAPKPCTRLKSTAVILLTLLSLAAVVTSCGRSDETFMHWKMKQVSSKEWLAMVSEIG